MSRASLGDTHNNNASKTDARIFRLIKDGVISPLSNYFISRNKTNRGNVLDKAKQPWLFPFIFKSSKLAPYLTNVSTTENSTSSDLVEISNLNENRSVAEHSTLTENLVLPENSTSVGDLTAWPRVTGRIKAEIGTQVSTVTEPPQIPQTPIENLVIDNNPKKQSNQEMEQITMNSQLVRVLNESTVKHTNKLEEAKVFSIKRTDLRRTGNNPEVEMNSTGFNMGKKILINSILIYLKYLSDQNVVLNKTDQRTTPKLLSSQIYASTTPKLFSSKLIASTTPKLLLSTMYASSQTTSRSDMIVRSEPYSKTKSLVDEAINTEPNADIRVSVDNTTNIDHMYESLTLEELKALQAELMHTLNTSEAFGSSTLAQSKALSNFEIKVPAQTEEPGNTLQSKGNAENMLLGHNNKLYLENENKNKLETNVTKDSYVYLESTTSAELKENGQVLETELNEKVQSQASNTVTELAGKKNLFIENVTGTEPAGKNHSMESSTGTEYVGKSQFIESITGTELTRKSQFMENGAGSELAEKNQYIESITGTELARKGQFIERLTGTELAGKGHSVERLTGTELAGKGQFIERLTGTELAGKSHSIENVTSTELVEKRQLIESSRMPTLISTMVATPLQTTDSITSTTSYPLFMNEENTSPFSHVSTVSLEKYTLDHHLQPNTADQTMAYAPDLADNSVNARHEETMSQNARRLVSTVETTKDLFFKNETNTAVTPTNETSFQNKIFATTSLPFTNYAFTFPAAINNRDAIPVSEQQNWHNKATDNNQNGPKGTATPSRYEPQPTTVMYVWRERPHQDPGQGITNTTAERELPPEAPPNSLNTPAEKHTLSEKSFQNPLYMSITGTPIPSTYAPSIEQGGNSLISGWMDNQVNNLGDAGVPLYNNVTTENPTAMITDLMKNVEQMSHMNSLLQVETSHIPPHVASQDLTMQMPDISQMSMTSSDASYSKFERILLMKTLTGLVKTMSMLQSMILESRTTTTTAAPTTTTIPTTTTTRRTTTTLPTTTTPLPTTTTTQPITTTVEASTEYIPYGPTEPHAQYMPTYDAYNTVQQDQAYNEMQKDIYSYNGHQSEYNSSTAETITDHVQAPNEIAAIRDAPSVDEKWAKAIAFVRKYVSG